MDALRAAIAPRELVLFDDVYYDAEAKEAVAFALLAYLHVARSAGNVTGATGARGPRVLGKLTPA
jgi:anhydro-N-acetylmuramic acid kinase